MNLFRFFKLSMNLNVPSLLGVRNIFDRNWPGSLLQLTTALEAFSLDIANFICCISDLLKLSFSGMVCCETRGLTGIL